MTHWTLPLLLGACRADPPRPAQSTPIATGGDDTAPGDDTASATDDTAPGDPDDTGDTGEASAPPAVILFIGDGMGPEHVAGGGVYAHGRAGTLQMETLPYTGRIRSASLTGVTDSAAAATSYAGGEKTWNDQLGLDRDGAALTSLVALAQARGLATGVVSTDALTGATPAAFLVHIADRYETVAIAEQEAANLPDVLLGGGGGVLTPLLEGADIQQVTDAAGLLAATLDDRPLVGLFASDTLPYVSEGLGDAPSLAQMTAAALAKLEASPDGFFLMVEGARIDHASHAMSAEKVHPETAAFDDAIAVAMAWAEGREQVTLLVTADHECGGMQVAHTGTAGETPETTWRWGAHTNADVPIYGLGDGASLFDGARLDGLWVHEVLAAAVEQRAPGTPNVVPLIDGWLDELGSPLITQTLDSDFGPGYDQLDALRLDADSEGIRVGLDGAFDRQNNAVVLLFDLDFGEGSGLGGSGSALPDTGGSLEGILSNLDVHVAVEGLGFDAAIVSMRAREAGFSELVDDSGLRGLRDPWASDGDLWWLPAILNYDDGNVSVEGEPGVDAGATGATEYGLEALLPWASVWPAGIPPEGQRVAVVALIVSTDGTNPSNQALPPYAAAPVGRVIAIDAAATLTVDGDGVAMGAAEITGAW